MNLSEYWQENKRFVLSVGAGTLVFVIAFAFESSLYDDELNSARREIQRYKKQLEDALYTSKDLGDAESENAALRSTVEQLTSAVRFQARPEFVPDAASGSSANHYLRALSRVREELLQRANRANLAIDSGLGMPELSPTVESQIIRYLEALDVVETVGDLAIRARARRIEKIQVTLDPGHSSRQGVGPIERTRVRMTLTGSSLAAARVLQWSQRPAPGGRVLAIDQCEMLPARAKRDEVRLDVTFVIARTKAIEPPSAEG